MAGYLPRRLAVTVRRALETFPDVRARALADLLGFLAEHAAPLILDEIQYTPELCCAT